MLPRLSTVRDSPACNGGRPAGNGRSTSRSLSSRSAETAGLSRRGAIGGCPVADLAVVVPAPAPDRAVTLVRGRVTQTTRNRRRASQAADLGRRGVADRVVVA